MTTLLIVVSKDTCPLSSHPFNHSTFNYRTYQDIAYTTQVLFHLLDD